MSLRHARLAAFVALIAVATTGCLGLGSAGGGTGGGGMAPPAQPAPVAPGFDGKPGTDPGSGDNPTMEDPVPGQVDLRPVNVWKMQPSVDGRHVTAMLSWWSGVAPCSVLDSVVVERVGTTITMTPREGSAPDAGGQACPDIALLRGTIVDLGELAPGTWTLVVRGDLAPVSVTVN